MKTYHFQRFYVTVPITILLLAAFGLTLNQKVDHQALSYISEEGPPMSYGSNDAPIKIVSFTDFECPYCAEAHQLIQHILEEYPEKIHVEVKNFPLPFHENAMPAALAALAAAKQGKYWEYSTLLFANQDRLQKASLLEYAQKTGLDTNRFSKDLADPVLQNDLANDLKYGEKLEIYGTPTLFVNGQRLDNNLSFTSLKSLIDDMLGYSLFEDSEVEEYNTQTVGSSPSIKPCSEKKMKEVLADVNSLDSSFVIVDCHLDLDSTDVVTKQLLLEGTASSGVHINCNGATIDAGKGTFHYNTDQPVIRIGSKRISKWNWERPKDIVIENCNIVGSVHVHGMTGGDHRSSAKTAEHTSRVRTNAPTNIVFDNIKITATGGSGINLPFYLFSGVTHVQLINSELNGHSGALAIYLDAESCCNTFRNNYIHTTTAYREIMAIDGSSHNKIINNKFSGLNNGGIFLYRNCGEKGITRHETPSHNIIVNNIFYYDKYKGSKPSVYLGSRNGERGFCNLDNDVRFGSGVSDLDHARFNIVAQNQIYNRSVKDMIKVKNFRINWPNYIAHNQTVSTEIKRPAGCYVTDTRSFLLHGQSKEVFRGFAGRTPRRCITYTCDDGNLSTSRTTCTVSQVNFNCQVAGDNKGCQTIASCPNGKKIVGAIAGCNLEGGSVSTSELRRIPINKIKVIRASDNVRDGTCYIQKNSLRSGQKRLTSINGLQKVSLGCKEHDKNGGDCQVKGVLYCH